MGDLGGVGDVAVGEPESRGALDRLVVVSVGLALAFGGALDAAKGVCAQVGAGAFFADALGRRRIALRAAPARIAALAASATRSACSATVAELSPHWARRRSAAAGGDRVQLG